jgi:TolB protein
VVQSAQLAGKHKRCRAGRESRIYVVQTTRSVNKKLAALDAVFSKNPAMRSCFRYLLLALAGVASVFADNATKIGEVIINFDRNATSIEVNGSTPELASLARLAFGAHGAYRLVTSGATYTLNFTQVAPAQVRVEITRGSAGQPVFSEVVAGTSGRNALLRAADVAVAHTSKLRGFFAGKLAFISDRGSGMEIMTSDLFGGEVVGWPGVSRQIIAPRWSPDGRRLIFTSFRNGFPDIYVLDLATRTPTLLVSVQGTNTGGRFSPDGGRVAMVLSGEGNSEIYVSNAQGRMISRLTRTPAIKAGPCWSPDGTRLVFTSEPGPQLYLMPAAVGSMPQRLPTNISGYCAEPDWCRWDANKLAFTTAVGKRYQVAVYDFSTRQAEVVSAAALDAIEPCWLADGRHLIYTAREANQRSLWILDTETRKTKRISPSALGQASQASYWSQ